MATFEIANSRLDNLLRLRETAAKPCQDNSENKYTFTRFHGDDDLLAGISTQANITCISQASVAQGLEHWSCKPGVESSNLSGG